MCKFEWTMYDSSKGVSLLQPKWSTVSKTFTPKTLSNIGSEKVCVRKTFWTTMQTTCFIGWCECKKSLILNSSTSTFLLTWCNVHKCSVSLRFDLEEWEHVTCMKTVALRSQETVSGLKGYIAAGTCMMQGEEVTCRGRVSSNTLVFLLCEKRLQSLRVLLR